MPKIKYGDSRVLRLTWRVVMGWLYRALREEYLFFVIVFTGNSSRSEYDVYFIQSPNDKRALENELNKRFPSLMFIIDIRLSLRAQGIRAKNSFFIHDN